jgi:hypothetical protein
MRRQAAMRRWGARGLRESGMSPDSYVDTRRCSGPAVWDDVLTTAIPLLI